MALLLTSAVATSGIATQAQSPADVSLGNSGTIEGIVYYQPDPARLWRYQRYYVSNPKTGELAEAVVALIAKSERGKTGMIHTEREEVMDQVNFRFVPETLTIRTGDSVRFKNSDNALHNVMTLGGNRPFNINLLKDIEHVQKFDLAAGLDKPLRLGCVYHGAMQAWIYVFDHPYYHVTGVDGRFRLAKVPPGEYELALRHAAGGLTWKKQVIIQAGETARVDIRISPDNLIKPPKK